MKKILSLLFICTFFLGFSQQKELSIEDAVLGYYKGLHPTSLQNLQWVKNTNSYVFQKENELIFTDAKNNKVISTIPFSKLQAAYSTLKKIPQIMEISNEEMVFSVGNQIETYNYKTNEKIKLVSFDENAKNNERI